MKPHAARIVGNLVTSLDDGSTWAVWQITPVPYGVATLDQRLAHKDALERQLRGLRRPTLLFSVCDPITPEAVAERMMRGATNPAWAERVERTVTELIVNGRVVHQRTFWLATQVIEGQSSALKNLKAVVTSALSNVFSSRWLVDDDDDDHLLDLIERAESGLNLTVAPPGTPPPLPTPGRIVARRATVADIEWLTVRLARRGTADDIAQRDWSQPGAESDRPTLKRLNVGAWGENWVDEDSGPAPKGPRRHVVTEANPGVYSYQTSLVLARAAERSTFPGVTSEWLHRASRAQAPREGHFPVDWFVYVDPLPEDKAIKKVQSRHRNMAGQVEEQHDDLTGAPGGVVDSSDILGEVVEELEANHEPLPQCVVWFTIAAPDLRTLRRRAAAFSLLYPSSRYDLPAPGHEQTMLVRSSQPGAPLPRGLLGDFRRSPTVGALAAAAAFTDADIGDPHGALVGVNMGDGHAGPVFLAPEWWSSADGPGRASSMLFVGSTGYGKSYAVKALVDLMAARGSQIAIVDLNGEYEPVVEACGGQLVNPYRARVSFDPLAILYASLDSGLLNAQEREEATDRGMDAVVGLVDQLFGRIEPNGAEWAALRAIVERAVKQRKRLAYVVNCCRTDAALKERYDTLKRVAAMPRMRALFDPDLPALDLSAGVTVIAMSAVSLPDKNHGPTSEELQGVMVLYGVVQALNECIYRDKNRHGLVVLDEAWALFRSRYATNMVDRFARDGRKFWAGVIIVTQDARDIPEKTIGQIDVRFVFGLLDTSVEGAAGNREAGLALLGDIGRDPEVVAAFGDAAWPAGRCLMQDAQHRAGVFHWLPPLDARMAEAVDTSARDRRAAAVQPAEAAGEAV